MLAFSSRGCKLAKSIGGLGGRSWGTKALKGSTPTELDFINRPLFALFKLAPPKSHFYQNLALNQFREQAWYLQENKYQKLNYLALIVK